jgi:ArsR family transcriptional regulator
MTTRPLSADSLVAALRAAGEPTRLRILALLREGELSVKDFTSILAQSQPRISRHLKLLAEAGLISRYPEGAFVRYRLADDDRAGAFGRALVAAADPHDPQLTADRERLGALREEQADAAARYFAANADAWNTIRSLHAADAAVEAAMLTAVEGRRIEAMLDVGTGTGRLLELFAPRVQRAVGVDSSPAMLGVARAAIQRAGLAHVQIRQGDLYNLALPPHSFDLVTIHQVLHFLDRPEIALAEAARMVRRGGRLIVVDFAPHALEFLREEHAHRRLGFDHETVGRWLAAAGLRVDAVTDLPADTPGDKLTVTLWLARDPHVEVAALASAAVSR